MLTLQDRLASEGYQVTVVMDGQSAFDLASRRATQVTRLEGEFARRFDLSPDGGWVVFERSKAADDYRDVDLWLARADGTGARLLVRGGLAPAWR